MPREETPRDESSLVQQQLADIGLEPHAVSERSIVSRIPTRVRRWAGALVVGVGVAYAVGYAAFELSKEEIPTQVIPATRPAGYEEDGVLRIASFNVKHHPERYAHEIDTLIQRDDLDAVSLQETFLERDRKLSKAMRGKYWMVFALANPRTGQGNTIITRAKPEKYSSVSLPGSTYNETIIGGITQLGKKLQHHQVNGDPARLADNLQEPRSALEVTIKVLINDKYIPVTVIDSHIVGIKHPEQHQRQFAELLRFVDKNTTPGKVTVVGADLNSGGNEAANRFVEHKFRTDQNYVSTTLDPTQRDPIDHVAYSEKGVEQVGTGVLRVISGIHSDHKLVEMNFLGRHDKTKYVVQNPKNSTITTSKVATNGRVLESKAQD